MEKRSKIIIGIIILIVVIVIAAIALSSSSSQDDNPRHIVVADTANHGEPELGFNSITGGDVDMEIITL